MQADSTVPSAFDFLRLLAGELSAGHLDLPSFPEIALRVRQVLADDAVTPEQVVRVVGSEPALSARLLRVANSASLNRSGRPVTELRTAISRIGHNLVRSAAMSFSMSQMKHDKKLAGIKLQLGELWERSMCVAAYAYVLARDFSKLNPDEALLGGMMHAIGKLYILTRALDHPALLAGEVQLAAALEEWQAAIGKAILENWGFSEALVQAVGAQDDLARAHEGAPDLGDVLSVGILIASYGTNYNGLQLALAGLPAARVLGLGESQILALMGESAAEVTALGRALGD